MKHKVARWVRAEIARRVGLTASAGVGPNKLVAKIASDVNKPDGLKIVPPDEVERFLAPLSVSRLWGVGPKSAERLLDLGIKTVADVRATDPALLERKLGSYGSYLARLAWGHDPRPVVTHREAKSRGSETTFAQDLSGVAEMVDVLSRLSADVADDLLRAEVRARTATLKVRYADFTTVTRSRTLRVPTRDGATLLNVVSQLLSASTQAATRPVRLLGVSTSHFVHDSEPEQLWFAFGEPGLATRGDDAP